MADSEIDAQQTSMLIEGTVQPTEELQSENKTTYEINSESCEVSSSDILQQALQEASKELETANSAYAEESAELSGKGIETKTDENDCVQIDANEQSGELESDIPVSKCLEDNSNATAIDAFKNDHTFAVKDSQVVPQCLKTVLVSATNVRSGNASTIKVSIAPPTASKSSSAVVSHGTSLLASNCANLTANTNSILKSVASSVVKTGTISTIPVSPTPTKVSTVNISPSGKISVAGVSLNQKRSAAPLGSSENPIQIIQQGNTYHSTQVLSRDQLQQIAHVLQQQQVTKAVKNGGSAVLYNPATNTRIIYRVIYPSELTTVKQNSSSPGKTGIGRGGGGAGRGRGKRRKNSTRNPEFSDDSKAEASELSRAEKEEKKKHRPRTRSGRISRPPSYMVKDYKRIHHLDFDEEPYDDSDGGYSDFQLSDEDGEHRHKHALPPGVSSSKPRKYKCNTCDKAYIGKGGLGRHYRLNPSHGSLPEADDVSTHDENSNSSLTPTRSNTSLQKSPTNESSFTGRICSGKENTCNENALAAASNGQKTKTYYQNPSVKRKSKLREFLHHCRDEELMEVVLPRLSQVITLWEFLLMKCEKGDPAEPDVSDILKNFESLIRHIQKLAKECLSPAISPKDDQKQYVEITNETVAQVLGISAGIYEVKNTRSEVGKGYQYKRLFPDTSTEQSTQVCRIVQVLSPDEVTETPPTKKQKVNESICNEQSNITVTLSNDRSRQILNTSSVTLASLHEENDNSQVSASQQPPNSNGSTESMPELFSGTPVYSNSAVLDCDQLQKAHTLVAGETISVLSTGCEKSTTSMLISGGSICSTLPIQDIRVRKVHILGCSSSAAETNSFNASEINAVKSELFKKLNQNSEGTENNNATEQMTRIPLSSSNHDVSIKHMLQNSESSSLSTIHSADISDKNALNTCNASLNDSVGASISHVFCQQTEPQVSVTVADCVLNQVPSDVANVETSQEMAASEIVLGNAAGDSFVSSIQVSDSTRNVETSDDELRRNSNGVPTESEEAVTCSEEVISTAQPEEDAQIVRHLILPGGHIIGVTTSNGHLEGLTALDEQLTQGFVPGNVIIIQNPDGTTTLQVPSDQPVPMETVQALLAMDSSLIGNEQIAGVEMVQQDQLQAAIHEEQAA